MSESRTPPDPATVSIQSSTAQGCDAATMPFLVGCVLPCLPFLDLPSAPRIMLIFLSKLPCCWLFLCIFLCFLERLSPVLLHYCDPAIPDPSLVRQSINSSVLMNQSINQKCLPCFRCRYFHRVSRAINPLSACLSGLLILFCAACCLDKVSDDAGHTYKFKASAERLDAVVLAVSEKLKMPKDAVLLKYADDDGDHIVLTG